MEFGYTLGTCIGMGIFIGWWAKTLNRSFLEILRSVSFDIPSCKRNSPLCKEQA